MAFSWKQHVVKKTFDNQPAVSKRITCDFAKNKDKVSKEQDSKENGH